MKTTRAFDCRPGELEHWDNGRTAHLLSQIKKQFVDGLVDADIQGDTEGFSETIERALRLDCIIKAKQAKQKRRSSTVVIHAYFEEEDEIEATRWAGVNSLAEQGSGLVLQSRWKRQARRHKNESSTELF